MESLFSPAGFNVETVTYKNINFTAWDVGGRDKIVSVVNTGVLVETITCRDHYLEKNKVYHLGRW